MGSVLWLPDFTLQNEIQIQENAIQTMFATQEYINNFFHHFLLMIDNCREDGK
jgi:hypothetical protein